MRKRIVGNSGARGDVLALGQEKSYLGPMSTNKSELQHGPAEQFERLSQSWQLYKDGLSWQFFDFKKTI